MPVFKVEVGGEHIREPHENCCRIWDHEDKYDNGSGYFQKRAVVPLFKVLAHGADLEFNGYLLDLPAKYSPYDQHPDKGIEEGDPEP